MVISDYALYWFDYKAGLSTVFAEFGWNYSRQLNVALCRGAATVQNKNWGVMIDWTYTNPPYLESGPQLLDDMKLAYDNGAKYIIIFDSNENYTQSTLQPEHLQAMQQFWQYAQANPRPSDPPSSRVAFVLPNDYGYGFRGPDDKIWGSGRQTTSRCQSARALPARCNNTEANWTSFMTTQRFQATQAFITQPFSGTGQSAR